MPIDYQQIIDITVVIIGHAVPLGVVFNISEWIVSSFFAWAFPKRYKER